MGEPLIMLPLCVCVRFQATQKGDPVAILKKQLEEREKQLAAEQEDASAAKNRLRELAKVRHTIWKSGAWPEDCRSRGRERKKPCCYLN